VLYLPGMVGGGWVPLHTVRVGKGGIQHFLTGRTLGSWDTPHRSWMYRLVSTAARERGCDGEEAWGSKSENPMGEAPLRVLKASFLLPFVGPSAHCYSALPG